MTLRWNPAPTLSHAVGGRGTRVLTPGGLAVLVGLQLTAGTAFAQAASDPYCEPYYPFGDLECNGPTISLEGSPYAEIDRHECDFSTLEAYDEALKVRTPQNAPSAYANTIANKANCLANLPDDPQHPEAGNVSNCAEAVALYRTAMEIFETLGEREKVDVIEDAIREVVASHDNVSVLSHGPH